MDTDYDPSHFVGGAQCFNTHTCLASLVLFVINSCVLTVLSDWFATCTIVSDRLAIGTFSDGAFFGCRKNIPRCFKISVVLCC